MEQKVKELHSVFRDVVAEVTLCLKKDLMTVEECREHAKNFVKEFGVKSDLINFHDGNGGLIMSVGGQDMNTGFFPMALYLIKGELVAFYGADKCIQSTASPRFFASCQYIKDLVKGNNLSMEELQLIVDAAESVSIFRDSASDESLKHGYELVMSKKPFDVTYHTQGQYVVTMSSDDGEATQSLTARDYIEANRMLNILLETKDVDYVSDAACRPLEIHTGKMIVHLIPIAATRVLLLNNKQTK